jgi:hypothetical protein
MNAEPQKEHQWLQRMVGEWTFEGSCVGPDGKTMAFKGTEKVRSIGGLWILAEGTGECPGGGPPMTSITTLGYDPQAKKFVGTFIASMMTFLWKYEGNFDATGNAVPLDCEGPSMADDGKMARYRDTHEIRSDNERVLTSQMRGEDGTWREFMRSVYRRAA